MFTEAFDAVLAVAISPDGRYWAAGSNRGEVRIWRDEGQTAYVAARAHTSAVPTVAFSPDGRTLASGSWDCTVKLWDVASKALLWNLQGHHGYVQSVAFGPGGGLLASGSDDGSIKLWDLSEGRCLATCSDDHTVRLWQAEDGILLWWNVESGVCLHVRQGHQAWIRSIAISPNGEMLASCGHDGVTHIWEMQSAAHLCTLRGDRPYERLAIVETTGLNEAQKTTLRALGAIEEREGLLKA